MWCENFTLEAPSTLVLPIALARERDIVADRDDMNTTVKIVGIKPERWKVEGRSNIPGPVILFTTRARLPKYPIPTALALTSSGLPGAFSPSFEALNACEVMSDVVSVELTSESGVLRP